MIVLPGVRPGPTGSRAGQCCFPEQPAGSARSGSNAPVTSTAKAAMSFSCPGPCRKSRPRPESSSRPRPGVSATPCALDARPPSPRRSTLTAYVTAATTAWPRPTCNTSSPPRAPTSSGSANTCPCSHRDLPAASNDFVRTSRPLPDPPKITNSIRSLRQSQISWPPAWIRLAAYPEKFLTVHSWA